MPTFTFHKPVEDIEEPVLLEEDWYRARISKAPSIEPNKAMKEDENSEKAGYNLNIPTVLTGNAAEGADGRMFTFYAPWPSEKDEGVYDGRGMKKADSKMQLITNIAEGFGGTVDGTDVTLQEGLEGFIYINRGLDQQGAQMQNNLDLFAGVKSVESFEGQEEEEASF